MGDDHKHEGDAGRLPSEELARALMAVYADWCDKPVVVQFRTALIPAVQKMDSSSLKDAQGKVLQTPVVVKTASGDRYGACLPLITKEGAVAIQAAAGRLEPSRCGTRLVLHYSLGFEGLDSGIASVLLHPAQIDYVQLVEAPPPPVPLVLKT